MFYSLSLQKFLFRLAIGLVVLQLAAVLAILLAAPRIAVLGLVGDDAGYYLNVARNQCLGHGWTFDRIVPTNGYNPLYIALIVPFLKAFGCDIATTWGVGMGISWSAVAISTALFFTNVRCLLRERVAEPDLPAAAATTLYVAFIGWKGHYGLDAQLVLGAAMGWWRQMQHPAADQSRHLVLRGALLAIAALARADSLALVGAAWTIEVAVERRRAIRTVGIQLATFAVLVTPYLAWSIPRFGTWMPVSARLKSTFPVIDVQASWSAFTSTSLHRLDQVLLLATGLLASAILTQTARRWWADETTAGRPRLAATASLYLLIRIAFLLLFSREDIQGGYVVLAHPYWMAVAAWAFSASASPSTALAFLGLGTVLWSGKATTMVRRWALIRDGEATTQLDLADQIVQRTSADHILYGGGFGLVGFASDRAWVNADGVTNTLAYQDVLRDHALEPYLDRIGVDWLVFFDHPRDADFGLTTSSSIYGTPARMNCTASPNAFSVILADRDPNLRTWVVPRRDCHLAPAESTP